MAKSPRIYQRLTRPRSGVATYSSLWLGPDHILLAQSTGFTEQYQRFQLSDIQAFLITPSKRRQNWAIVWTVIGLIALVPLIISLRQAESPFISGPFLLLALLALVINQLLGPACNVAVVTQVQTTRLPLVRRRTTDKVLARVQPLIAAAQADLLAAPDLVLVPPPPHS